MISTNRRSFLRLLGIGAATTAVLPEIIQSSTQPITETPIMESLPVWADIKLPADFKYAHHYPLTADAEQTADAMGKQMALTREMIQYGVIKGSL